MVSAFFLSQNGSQLVIIFFCTLIDFLQTCLDDMTDIINAFYTVFRLSVIHGLSFLLLLDSFMRGKICYMFV